jgi:cation:H+ antiporter
LFLSFYVAYVAYLILTATQHEMLPAYSFAMMSFVLPLAGIGVAMSVWRALKKGNV